MSETSELPILTPAEARILGCLIEKKQLTPDIYPMTLNAILTAANQKTARDPVMAIEVGEARRALSMLEQKGLVRQIFASRVERYEHLAAQRFSLTTPQFVILGLLLLRGPQTAHELLARSERMASLSSVEDLRDQLDLMGSRKPPLIQLLERAPGQREERYAQLLGGPVSAPAPVATRQTPASDAASDVETRLVALEEEIEALKARLAALEGR